MAGTMGFRSDSDFTSSSLSSSEEEISIESSSSSDEENAFGVGLLALDPEVVLAGALGVEDVKPSPSALAAPS